MTQLHGERLLNVVLLALVVSLCMPGSLYGQRADVMRSPKCTEWNDAIVVSVGGKEMFRYQKAERVPPAGIDAIYKRSGYLHPVRTPTGRLVTGDFGRDHAHQRAIFSAWVKTTFQDREVDFWNFHRGTGRVAHERVIDVTNDKRGASFRVELVYEDVTDAQRFKRALVETWTVQIPRQFDSYFVFDIALEQRCATDDTVQVLQNEYGGMALRANNDWFPSEDKPERNPEAVETLTLRQQGCRFLTSEGRNRADGNHTRARWVSAFGVVDDRVAGITIMGHPDNFRAPQKVRLHPTKPYFCFAPMVDGSFEIAPDQPYRAKYRYVVYDGEPDTDEIEGEWRKFAQQK